MSSQSFATFFNQLADKTYNIHTWEKYYRGEEVWLHKSEICLKYLLKYIPRYIKNILILGCANGRDFIPFDGKYHLYGLDIVSFSEIRWIRPFQNLVYRCLTVEDLTKMLEYSDVDLHDTLIYSIGTLMYVSEHDQKKFYEYALISGCVNLIFQEYPFARRKERAGQCLYLQEYQSHFIVKNYRMSIDDSQPHAFINMDVSPQIKDIIKNEFIEENAFRGISGSRFSFKHFLKKLTCYCHKEKNTFI